MKQLIFTLLTFISLSVSAQSSAISGAPIKLHKGQSITMVSNSESNLDMGMEMNQNSSTTVKIEVMDVTEKGYRVSKTITKLKVTLEVMGQEMKYDSENPSESDEKLSEGMSKKIGKSEFGTLDMMTGAYTPDKKSDDEEGGNPIAGLLGGNDESDLGVVLVLPADKKTGDSWTTTNSPSEGIKSTSTYTLNSNDGKSAAISFKGTMEMKKEAEAQGTTMNIEMKGTSSGTLTMDPSTGLLKSRTSNDEMEGTIGAMGQNSPVSGKTTTNTTYTY